MNTLSATTEWKGKIISSCKRGDTERIDGLLQQHDDVNWITHDLLRAMACAIVDSKRSDALAWFLNHFPDFQQKVDPFKEDEMLYHIHFYMFSNNGKLDMYKVLADRYPQVCSWDYKHSGNPLGMAARANDLEWATYLISKGAKADEAWIGRHKASRFPFAISAA